VRLRQQRGFVLATTLWVLAILTVAAAYFAERMQHARQLAEQAQLRTQALVDMAGTRAEILFRLATTPISLYGLGASAQDAIALDDRAYGGLGDTLVRLQDSGGLLDLNIATDDQLERFLNVLGVPAARRAAMIDALRDYVDEDNLKRLTDHAPRGEEYLRLEGDGAPVAGQSAGQRGHHQRPLWCQPEYRALASVGNHGRDDSGGGAGDRAGAQFRAYRPCWADCEPHRDCGFQ